MSVEEDVAALKRRVDELEHELAIQQDIHAVRKLQYAYGYFIDKSQYNEVVDLFSDDGEVWFLGGIYKGIHITDCSTLPTCPLSWKDEMLDG